MKKISLNKETKIGLFVTLCIIAMIWGINFLKGKNIFSPNYVYYTWFPSVNGLEVTNDVLVNGFKIGLVNDIHFEYKNPESKKFLVTILVEKKYPIPQKSVAKLVSADLLGGMAIRLDLSNEKNNYTQGDTLPSAIEAGLIDVLSGQISPLMQNAQTLFTNLNQAVEAFNSILNKNSQAQLTQAIQKLNLTLNSTAQATATLDTMLNSPKGSLRNSFSNFESISANLKNSNSEISKLIKNFSSISDTISQAKLGSTITKLDSSLQQISLALNHVNKGKGTAGKLVYSDSLYNNLENATKNLEVLLKDINENPKKYVKFSVF